MRSIAGMVTETDVAVAMREFRKRSKTTTRTTGSATCSSRIS